MIDLWRISNTDFYRTEKIKKKCSRAEAGHLFYKKKPAEDAIILRRMCTKNYAISCFFSHSRIDTFMWICHLR